MEALPSARDVTDGSAMVRAVPGWLCSPNGSLFAWLHEPSTGRVRGGVVLCPSLLFEYYDAYATFRVLADRLAQAGLAALRFDYSGTGDSSGHPADISDVATWRQNIGSAVDELRNAGAQQVVVVAMRAGANLLASAAGQCGADAVILWDPFPSGRAFVRPAMLLHNSITGKDDAGTAGARSDAPTPEEQKSVPEAAPFGFDFPKSFVDSLKALTLEDTPHSPRMLVLTRDGQLPTSLQGREQDGIECGVATGQEALLETYPDRAKVPEATVDLIVGWATSLVADRPAQPFSLPLSPVLDIHDEATVEKVVQVGDIEHVGLFGIVTEPAKPTPIHALPIGDQQHRLGNGADRPLTCIFFNSGIQHHIGPNRLYVDLARRLAKDGIRSIRLDLSGVGDSPARSGYLRNKAYSPAILDDIDLAIRFAGDGPKVALGLCSGGYHALEAGARYDLRGVIAIHYSLENGILRNRPETHSPRRQITHLDRRWLRFLSKSRVGIAVVWRIPGPVWWLLDRLKLQTDVSVGVRSVVERGRNVVMLVETSDLRRPRWWQLLHGGGTKPVIVSSTADHALFDLNGRSTTADVVRDFVLEWRDLNGPADEQMDEAKPVGEAGKTSNLRPAPISSC